MKNIILTLTLFATCILYSFNPINIRKEATSKAELEMKTDSILRHVVLFKFKESSTPEDIKKIEDAFGQLPDKIAEIEAYEWGLNNSPENLNKDFTHCFLVTFKSEEDRAVYLPHPAHLAFVAILKPHLEDVFVLDYWTR